MKLTEKLSTYSGTYINNPKSKFTILDCGRGLINIYIDCDGTGNGNNLFSVWIEDCPHITTDKQVWKIMNELRLTEKCANALCKTYFQKGIECGKEKLQNDLKFLLTH